MHDRPTGSGQMQLEAGKIAVVTGCRGSGIGFVLKERFATAGMNVVLADVDEAGTVRGGREGRRTRRRDAHGEDRREQRGIGAGARGGNGRALRHRARGVQQRRCDVERPTRGSVRCSTWEWVMGVNFWGVLHGVRAFMPLLVGQGEGHVVNTAPIAGLVPGFGAPYDALKHRGGREYPRGPRPQRCGRWPR